MDTSRIPRNEWPTPRVTDLPERVPIRHAAPAQQHAPPETGDSVRQAVSAVVDDIVNRICTRIKTMHDRLEDLQREVLASSAEAKGRLDDHITVCQRIEGEIVLLDGVVTEIRRAALPVTTR